MIIFNCFFIIGLLYPTIIHSQLISSSPSSTTTTTTTTSPNKNVTCVCDNQTTKSNNQGTCAITLDAKNEAIAYNGVCACQFYQPFYYRFSSTLNLYTVSCVAGTTTTTTTTTTTKTPKPTSPGETTVAEITDGSGDGITTENPDENVEEEEIIYMGSCNTTALSKEKRKISKILTYVASIWVILWTFATFITNIFCK